MDTICSCPEELLSNRVQSSARSISSDGLRKAQFLGTPGSLTTSDISSPTRLAFETGCADMPPTGSDIRTRRPRICLKTGVGRRHLHDGTRQRNLRALRDRTRSGPGEQSAGCCWRRPGERFVNAVLPRLTGIPADGMPERLYVQLATLVVSAPRGQGWT